ncbi:hypothetical protein VTI28DRAFT_4381 [Corynascus sepedonium]
MTLTYFLVSQFSDTRGWDGDKNTREACGYHRHHTAKSHHPSWRNSRGRWASINSDQPSRPFIAEADRQSSRIFRNATCLDPISWRLEDEPRIDQSPIPAWSQIIALRAAGYTTDDVDAMEPMRRKARGSLSTSNAGFARPWSGHGVSQQVLPGHGGPALSPFKHVWWLNPC